MCHWDSNQYQKHCIERRDDIFLREGKRRKNKPQPLLRGEKKFREQKGKKKKPIQGAYKKKPYPYEKNFREKRRVSQINSSQLIERKHTEKMRVKFEEKME